MLTWRPVQKPSLVSTIAQTRFLARGTLNTIPRGLNPMNTYYVLRREAEFKIIYMDRESAERWHDAGWEMRSHDSNEKAQLAMAEWEASTLKPALFAVRREA